MERKNRNILVVCIAVVIVIAVFSSFGLSLFAPDTAKITLPTPTPTNQPENEHDGQGSSGLVRVEVTNQTVQEVIRTLSRPHSYAREVTVEDFWGGGASGITTANVVVDGGWTATTAQWSGGTVRHSIVGDDTLWFWYNNDKVARSTSADDASADLEGQRILSYEDVLTLTEEEIADTNYRTQGGLDCIYVETAPDALGYRDRYWVAVDSGLLVCAETLNGEELVYRMTAYGLEQPATSGTEMALPDGTVLHTVGGISQAPTGEEAPA